jgi:hypothetical protein
MAAPADWYGDPMQRAQYRYWDGDAWTSWVSDNGAVRVDDVAAPAPPPPPAAVPPPPLPQSMAAHPPPPAPTSHGYGPEPYRSLRGLTTALTWLLVVAAVSCLGAAVAHLVRASRISDFADAPSFRTLGRLDDADDAVGGTRGWLLAVSVAVFVLLVIYLFKAAKNTERWQAARARWTPGWAIGGWFIPFANLVIPVLVVLDIWRRSPEDGREPGIAVVIWWWVLYLVGFTAMWVGRDEPDDLDTFRTLDDVAAAGAVLAIASAILLVVVVRRLAARQQALAAAAPTAAAVG